MAEDEETKTLEESLEGLVRLEEGESVTIPIGDEEGGLKLKVTRGPTSYEVRADPYGKMDPKNWSDVSKSCNRLYRLVDEMSGIPENEKTLTFYNTRRF